MAYFSKKEVEKYVFDNNELLLSKNLKPFTPIEQCEMQLKNEEDVVGFFWVELNEGTESGVKINEPGPVDGARLRIVSPKIEMNAAHEIVLPDDVEE